MLTGRFGDTSGRPYMEGRLYLPRLNLQGDISFLVDTGADNSMLMPADAIRIAVPFDRLRGDNEAVGIGGAVHCFVERAILVFTQPNVALYAYELHLDILQFDPTMMDFSSLLGRDVLDRWRITYDRERSELRAKVRSADLTYDLRPPAAL